MHIRTLSLVLGALAIACAPDPSAEIDGDPIIGGADESFFAAVGTLVDTSSDGTYLGSYCTATLIRPHWVLTAAHCVTPSNGLKYFFLGEDSRAVNGQLPAGRFIRVAEEHVHPDYLASTSSTTLADIALIRLYDEVDDVAPFPIDPFGVTSGESLRYVGYGVDGTYDPSSAGRKRSTDLVVAPPINVQPSWFVSYRFGTNICFGDSGGPALRKSNGGWHVVGVNSAVFGTDPNIGQNPCDAGSLQVRVDYYADWIASILTNVSKYKCEGLYDCLIGCADPNDPGCTDSCVNLTAPEGLQDYLPLNDCFAANCTATATVSCSDACANEIAFCLPGDACSPLGGDCPLGEACHLRGDGLNECFPTDGWPVGTACEVDAASGVLCADGSACSEGECRAYCADASACRAGETCFQPNGAGTLGICSVSP